MASGYMDVAVESSKAVRARQQTHWILWDAPKFGRRGSEEVRAVCGYMVPLASFSTEPTCAECAKVMQDDVETAKALGIQTVS